MEPQALEIEDYIRILKRRKWSLILTSAMVIALAGAVALLLPSIYQSSATILIQEQDIPNELVTTTVTGYAEQRIQITQQRIMSTSKLMEIIERHHLYEEYRDRWSLEEIITKMRDDIGLELISAETIDRRTGRPTAATIAFTLSYEGKQPATVQKVTDNLVSLFLGENLQDRRRQTTETTIFLENEARRVRGQLDELEKKISAFKEEHIKHLPEMAEINMQTLSNLEVRSVRIDDQVRMLREREGYLETQLANIPESGDTEKQRLRQLELELVDLQTRVTDDYPDVKKIKREINELKNRMAAKAALPDNQKAMPDNTAYITLASQLSSTRAEIQSLLNQKADLQGKIEEYQGHIQDSPKVEQEYRALVMDRDQTQQEYQELLAKVMHANVAMGLEKEQKGERFTLIDPARYPTKPHKPNRLAIALIGIVLGVGAGVGFAALREFSDQSIHSASDLAGISTKPVLVVVPNILTTFDRSRLRVKRMAWGVATLVGIGASVFAFHALVMDLNVFWSKLMRNIPLM